MRAREVLAVVIENQELDTDFCSALGNLYLEFEELFPDEVINVILDRAMPLHAWGFHKVTNKRCHSRMVQRVLDGGFMMLALDMLDETCDQETFTRVLAHPHQYNHREYTGVLKHKVSSAMEKMRKLNLRREILVFENLVHLHFAPEDLERLFREMINEHPCITAELSVYQKVFDSSHKLSFKHLVAKEARAKGVKLVVSSNLLESSSDYSDDDWRKIMGLVLEIVEEPVQAYQIMLNKSQDADVVTSIIREAICMGMALDVTPKLVKKHLYFDLQERLGKHFLVTNLKKGLIKLDDEALAKSLDDRNSSAGVVFEFATRATSQGFPRVLEEILCTEKNPEVSRLMFQFEAFCNLVEPNEKTCKLLANKLLKKDMVIEAQFVIDTCCRTHPKSLIEKDFGDEKNEEDFGDEESD